MIYAWSSYETEFDDLFRDLLKWVRAKIFHWPVDGSIFEICLNIRITHQQEGNKEKYILDSEVKIVVSTGLY